MSSLNEEETDGDESRPASRKPSSTKRLSVLSNGGISARNTHDPCTIRHMKIKERSCSERSDSGFSECANHSSGTCTCEKKPTEVDHVVVAKDIDTDRSLPARPLNHKLLKHKLERIASLQFDAEENIVVAEQQQSRCQEVPQVVTLRSNTTTSLTSAESVKSEPHEEKEKEEEVVVAGSIGGKLDLRSDSIKSELDYDIKRFNLDGSSVRLRKKSLENQAKKELAVAPAIKVSSRVSDLKSRFDSAPIIPAFVAARKKDNTHVSTMTINLDQGPAKKGNKRFRLFFQFFCCEIYVLKKNIH